MSTDRSDPALAYTLPFQLTKKIHRKVPAELLPEDKKNAQPGKIIVITGGGTGIGAAFARVWVRAGAEGVVIAGRRKEKLDQTVTELKQLVKGGDTRIVAVPTDVTSESSVNNLYSQVNKIFGRPADVVVANAGKVTAFQPAAEETIATWWSVFELNVLGVHNTIACWIRSQPDPKAPVGTVIDINSGLAGVTVPGNSAYSITKIASHRYMEFVEAEYPSLRTFTLLPGIVGTEMGSDIGGKFDMYAVDEAELAGVWGLYLASPRADWLKGSLTSVNWDLEEMETKKLEIERGLLKSKWVPVLPCSGGEGI